MREKIIIIGAGVGGLAAAVRFLAQGHNVTIFEKNETVGGRVAGFTAGGYTFSHGAVLTQDIDEYTAVFQAAGESINDYLTIKRLPVNFQFIQRQKRQVFASDFQWTLKQMAQVSEKNCQDYLAYVSSLYSRHRFRTYYQQFAQQKVLQKNGTDGHHDQASEIIDSFISDRRLKDALLFQSAFPGQAIKGCIRQKAIVPAVLQMEGIYHILGGIGEYANALAALVKKMGGQIETNASVSEIIMAGDTAIGVKSTKGIQLADKIICNANPAYVLEHLLPKAKSDVYTDETFQYSCGAFVLHIASDKEWQALSVHNCIYDDHLIRALQSPYHGRIARKIPLYIYYPTAIDKSLAPVNQSVLSIIARVPNGQNMRYKWSAKQKCRLVKRILQSLAQIDSLQEFEEHIVAMSCLTPKDMDSRFNLPYGSVFGCQDKSEQKLTAVDGLYFVGDSAGDSAGVHQALKSARQLADYLLSHEKIPLAKD